MTRIEVSRHHREQLARALIERQRRAGDTTYRDRLGERMVEIAERMVRDSQHSIAEMSPAQRCVHAALEASDGVIGNDAFWTVITDQITVVIDSMGGKDAVVR